MDGDKYDLDGLKEELLYDVFGNWICGCDQRDDMVPEMLERCCTLLDSLYQNALKESLQAHPGKSGGCLRDSGRDLLQLLESESLSGKNRSGRISP